MRALGYILALAIVVSFYQVTPAHALVLLDGRVLAGKNAQGHFENFVVTNVGTSGALVVMAGYYLPNRGMTWVDIQNFTLAVYESRVLLIGENTAEGPLFYQQRYAEGLRIVVLTSDGIAHPIKMRPRADFNFEFENNVARFLDRSVDSDGRVVRWLWNFGDNTTSNLQNPTHTYSPGTFTATLTVWDDDNLSDSIAKVVAPPFEFSLSASPSVASIAPGDNATTTVTVSLISGVPTTVALSATGLPGNTTVGFSPGSGTPSFGSTMTITTSANTPTGSYTVTIAGTGENKIRTTSYALNITTGGAPSQPEAWISGKVVEKYTKLPVPYVDIVATMTDPGAGGWHLYFPAPGATTDSNGNWSIRVVANSYGTTPTSWSASFTFSKSGWSGALMNFSSTATYQAPNIVLSPSSVGTVELEKLYYGSFTLGIDPWSSVIKVIRDSRLGTWVTRDPAKTTATVSGSYYAPIDFSVDSAGLQISYSPTTVLIVDPREGGTGTASSNYSASATGVEPNSLHYPNIWAIGRTGFNPGVKTWTILIEGVS